MKKIALKHAVLMLALSGAVSTVWAGATVDYVATGGLKPVYQTGLSVQQSEIFISKKQVRTSYKIKNSTNKTINETFNLPLPKVESYGDTRPNTGGLIGSLNVTVNGKAVKPTASVRTYLHPLKANGQVDKLKYLDVTAEFKSCGFSQSELMNPWTQAYDSGKLAKRLLECKNETIQQLIQPYIKNDSEVLWFADANYSWKQAFKANETLDIKHSYTPLVGQGSSVTDKELKVYCADQNFRNLTAKSASKGKNPSYSEIMYWNGVQAKQPIPEFKLTVERDADEIVTFCWDGETKKVADQRFEMQKTNFLFTRPLGVLFVKAKK